MDKLPKAISHRHMIFQEAAAIAKEGEVKELWLTHYSPSMTTPEVFAHEARAVFEGARAGKDRKTKTIMYEDEE
jgi:ribonuclease Z